MFQIETDLEDVIHDRFVSRRRKFPDSQKGSNPDAVLGTRPQFQAFLKESC